MNSQRKTVYIVAGAPPVTPPGSEVLHWDTFEVPHDHLSLPRELAKEADSFKSTFLDWIATLAETRIEGKTLAEHFALDEERSLWWMGLVQEKSPLKSPGIYQVLQCRTIELLAERRFWSDFYYCGSDAAVDSCLRSFCARTGRTYRSKKMPLRVPFGSRNLPHCMQAFAYLLRFLWIHWPFLLSRAPSTDPPRGQWTYVTYFPNLDENALKEGLFRSHYLGPLHDLIEKKKVSGSQWVWFYSHRGAISSREAIRARNRCRKKNPEERFFFLQEFLHWRDLAEMVRAYFKIRKAANRLATRKSFFSFPGSKLNFYSLLEFDWNSSFYGHTLTNNLISLALTKNCAHALCGGGPLLYIWENQPWELALLWAWRAHRGGPTLAAQHSALPPLLLRSFNRSELFGTHPFSLPSPDLLLVNGKKPEKQMTESGYPPKRIRVVEALRYQYLNQVSTKVPPPGPRTLLVATGYTPEEARRQLSLIAAEPETRHWRILIKPHPFLSVERMGLTGPLPSHFEISHRPMAELLGVCDRIFVANMSAVAVEAAVRGLPVAVHVDPTALNLSPLFGEDGVCFVYDNKDLDHFLREGSAANLTEPWFSLDPELSQWGKTLFEEFQE